MSAPNDRQIGAPDSTVFEYIVGIFRGEGHNNDDTAREIAAAVRLEPIGEVDPKTLLPTWKQCEMELRIELQFFFQGFSLQSES